MGLASAAAHAHYVNGMVGAGRNSDYHHGGGASGGGVPARRHNDSDDRDDHQERERGKQIKPDPM